MPSVVVGEGAVDVAVMSAIAPAVEVPKPEERLVGRENAILRAATAAKMIDRKVVLVLDRNGFSAGELDKEVGTALGRSWSGTPARHEGWFLHPSTSSAVRLVIAGLPQDPTLKDLGVARFTMDDYLLLLCLHPDALGAFCAGARIAHRIAAADLHRVIGDLAELLRAKGIAIESSKRYMDLVRAIVGFQGSRATFAGEIIRKCPEHVREEILGPLARDITTDPPLPSGA